MSNDIREFAMRLVDEQVSEDIGAGWQTETKVFADGIDVERLVRAAMREALLRAADAIAAREGVVERANTYRGHVTQVAAFALEQLQAARIAIRAEADKLEGK